MDKTHWGYSKNTTIIEERWIEEGEGVVNELASTNEVVHILCRDFHLNYPFLPLVYSQVKNEEVTLLDLSTSLSLHQAWCPQNNILNNKYAVWAQRHFQTNQKIPNYWLGQPVPVRLLTGSASAVAVKLLTGPSSSCQMIVLASQHMSGYWPTACCTESVTWLVTALSKDSRTSLRRMIDIKCDSSTEHSVLPSIVEMWQSPHRSHCHSAQCGNLWTDQHFFT